MIRILTIFLMIMLYFISPVHAKETLSQQALEEMSNQLYSDLQKDDDWEKALEKTKELEALGYENAYQLFAIIYGSGRLKSGIHRCEATIAYEKWQESPWAMGYLNLDILYDGKWRGVAALEGNRLALHNVAMMASFKNHGSLFLALFNQEFAVKKAYHYYYNSALQGYEKAESSLKSLEKRFPFIDFSDVKKPMKFQEILCPVRVYEDAKTELNLKSQ